MSILLSVNKRTAVTRHQIEVKLFSSISRFQPKTTLLFPFYELHVTVKENCMEIRAESCSSTHRTPSRRQI